MDVPVGELPYQELPLPILTLYDTQTYPPCSIHISKNGMQFRGTK